MNEHISTEIQEFIKQCPQRILILGSGGAGKSTLARCLNKSMRCQSSDRKLSSYELIHLDEFFWLPGWVERDVNDFDALLETQLEKPSWIMDGNYNRTLEHRLKYADCAIFLDFNRFRCAYRIFKRWLFDGGEQAKDCPQKVDFEFFKYVIWDFPRDNRKRIYNKLSSRQSKTDAFTSVILKSPKDVRLFLSAIQAV